jgi:hypothetical protein
VQGEQESIADGATPLKVSHEYIICLKN